MNKKRDRFLENHRKTKRCRMGRILSGLLVLWMAVWGIAFACGIRSYIVMSGSMEPTISTGSVCFVNTRVKYQDIQEGDVIAFFHGNGMVTHRVRSITAEGLETKGDANDRSDGITTGPGNFHGKTIFHIPYVGYGMAFCKRPLMQCFFILLLVFWMLWDTGETERQRREKN